MDDRQAFGCPARCTVLPHRPAVNDLLVTDCVNSHFVLFFATNTILVDQASSGRLTISRLLGDSPSKLCVYITPSSSKQPRHTTKQLRSRRPPLTSF